MKKETEDLLITVLKKLNTILDSYAESNNLYNYRLVVINSAWYGDTSLLIYKTKSNKFTDTFYYDTDIAEAINLNYEDELGMSQDVSEYLNKTGDFELIEIEYASDYLQKELWRVNNPIDFLENDDESKTCDVFNFRLCAEKYIIPKYKKLLNLED